MRTGRLRRCVPASYSFRRSGQPWPRHPRFSTRNRARCSSRLTRGRFMTSIGDGISGRDWSPPRRKIALDRGAVEVPGIWLPVRQLELSSCREPSAARPRHYHHASSPSCALGLGQPRSPGVSLWRQTSPQPPYLVTVHGHPCPPSRPEDYLGNLLRIEISPTRG